MLLRDKFWLWGHPEGCYNDAYGNNNASRMTPMEGCLYLGVRNTFMVPVGKNVNRRQYNKSFKTLNCVGWECFSAAENPDAVEPLIEDAKDFDNIGCVVFDDSGLSIFTRYQDNANTEGGGLYLLSFGKDGYIDLGSDFVPSETFKTEPLYKLGEWFKVKVEVLTENQSMILYVANLNSNGEYGDWVRVNDIPVGFRFNTSAATNKEVHTAFEELVLNLHSRTDSEALWYLKSAKISELADSKTETVLFEDFDDNTMNVNHVNLINVHNENDSYGDYLLLTPMKDVGDKTLTSENGDASVDGKGQIFRTGKYNSASTTPYYDETVPFDITSFENYTTNKISHTQTRPTMPVIGEYTIVEPEYWKGDVDLSDAEKVTVSFDFYDAGVARHPSVFSSVRDTLKIGFAKTEQGVKPTDQMLDSVYLQNGSAKSLNSGSLSASYTRRVWDKASLTFSPYTDSSTKNISLFLEGSNRTITCSFVYGSSS